MRTITIVVRKPSGGGQATFCRQHPSGSYAASVVDQGVPSVAGRLTLLSGECPRCAGDALAAGRACLAPEALNALGERVPLVSLLDGAVPVEREFLNTVMAAADSAGAADLAALARALRRANARPGSAESVELRDALRTLLSPPSAPCCALADLPDAPGVYGGARRWRRAV